MELRAGISRLGHLAGIESLTRNLEAEDAAVRRNIERLENELLEPEEGEAMSPSDDAMRIMAARDVHVYQPAPGPAATATPIAAAAPIAQQAADTPLWKRALALAAIVSGMGGTAGLASWLTSRAAPNPPAAAEQIVPPGYGLDVEVERPK